ncbi:hypothetical protein Hanom_Chr15g01361191 [Helianthus anomalus]
MMIPSPEKMSSLMKMPVEGGGLWRRRRQRRGDSGGFVAEDGEDEDALPESMMLMMFTEVQRALRKNPRSNPCLISSRPSNPFLFTSKPKLTRQLTSLF